MIFKKTDLSFFKNANNNKRFKENEVCNPFGLKFLEPIPHENDVSNRKSFTVRTTNTPQRDKDETSDTDY